MYNELFWFVCTNLISWTSGFLVELWCFCWFGLFMLICSSSCFTSISCLFHSPSFMSTILFHIHPALHPCWFVLLFELLADDVACYFGISFAFSLLSEVVAGFCIYCCHSSHWLLVSGHALWLARWLSGECPLREISLVDDSSINSDQFSTLTVRSMT